MPQTRVDGVRKAGVLAKGEDVKPKEQVRVLCKQRFERPGNQGEGVVCRAVVHHDDAKPLPAVVQPDHGLHGAHQQLPGVPVDENQRSTLWGTRFYHGGPAAPGRYPPPSQPIVDKN